MGALGVGQPGLLCLLLAEEREQSLLLGDGGGERKIGGGVCGDLEAKWASFFGDGKGWEREKVG